MELKKYHKSIHLRLLFKQLINQFLILRRVQNKILHQELTKTDKITQIHVFKNKETQPKTTT